MILTLIILLILILLLLYNISFSYNHKTCCQISEANNGLNDLINYYLHFVKQYIF